ncbi:uncharacterized protein LOC121847782 isoform X4 [Oncorhynchus tshawytscha]|uniref:uncharacterized protein LOC121847782 isoform X4 n=1 Tax=Oncorhynchus tshawytscha TaxID=74940 RepID=UPI001C3E338A|nr:uncharacterized protein LOC121847782 isoform X4 [Oncorhynchus tshawytscha]
MANCMVFHTQIASIMEVLANAAVAEICKLVDDDYAVIRLEMSQSQKENRGLRRKLQLLELKVARERAERVLASRPSSVKILDRYRGMARGTFMARGEGHLTGGHRGFVKPVGHNTWRDDQPITVDEGSGTSTQHVIVIEYADAEAAGPGVKQERSEGEENKRHNIDIQTGAAAGVVPPVATEDSSTTPSQPRTRRSITEEGEGPEVQLIEEGCEEGLGNPEGTMVIEDNQTTPPESTKEPVEQHRTTHSLTETAVHEDLLISGVAGGRDWTSEAAGHKAWPRIRTLDQEQSLLFPESEQESNHKGQRLHHHTEHNRWTGGLNNLSPGGHQRDRGSSQGSSLQPRDRQRQTLLFL